MGSTSFFEGGNAYEAIDPSNITNLVNQAAASAAAAANSAADAEAAAASIGTGGGGGGTGNAGTVSPVMDGAATVGTSANWAHEDHVHPTDTSRASVSYVDTQVATKTSKTYVDTQDALKADKTYVDTQDALKADKTYVDTQDALKAPVNSPSLTGTPTSTSPAANDNSLRIATTAWVLGNTTALSTTLSPLMNGVVAIGTSALAARADHIHPTDTSRAPASFTQVGTGAISRTVNAKLTDVVSATDFAACDGITDDTAKLQNALDTGKVVVIPSNATCLISSTLTITRSYGGLIGGGMLSSVLKSNSASATMISVAANVVGITLSGFSLTRSVTATAGASGIIFLGETDETIVSNLWITKQYNGLDLSTTNYSLAQNIVSIANYGDGITVNDTTASGTCQWYFDCILTTQNAARGLLCAPTHTRQIALGNWTGIYTFANSSFGVALVGNASAPIYGLRLYNSFLGGDGNSTLYADTYGGQHIICNSFFELAGAGTTGPTQTTAASHVGDGLTVTGNNLDIVIMGCYASGNSVNGFNISASVMAQLVGCRSINNGGYGAYFADGAKASAPGCTFSGNVSAPVGCGANFTSLDAPGCKPAINSGQIPATLTNDDASTGKVGEYIESVVSQASAVSLVTGTAKTWTSISLPPGDWEVDEVANFTGGGTTLVVYLGCGINLTTTNTLDQTNGRFLAIPFQSSAVFNATPSGIAGICLPPLRVKVPAGPNQVVYAIAQSAFSTSTCTVFGILRARRAR